MQANTRSLVRKGILISAAAVGLMLVGSAAVWPFVPADRAIPTHWGIDGRPDAYGGKFQALLVLPLVALGLSVLLAVIPCFEPRSLHLARSAKAYLALWAVVLGLLVVLHGCLVAAALGVVPPVGTIAPVLIGVLFAVIGNYMGKVKSNYFFGIRTPWTLSSELAWNRTHRVAGRLFVALGVSIVVAALFLPGPWTVGVMVVGVGIILVFVMVYSYRVWRTDPAKETVGR